MAGPMEQFVIKPLLPLGEVAGIDLAITNAAAFMIGIVALVFLLLTAGTASRSLVPGRLQSITEVFYEFIANTVRQTTGKEGMRFFPFVFSLFMFVLFANLLGMFPGGFTVTSQIIITFALAMLVILTVLGYGIYKHGFHFFNLFFPSGAPGWLLPFMFVIEVISFLSRPISLSLRLFGNMLAGHIALKVFAGFVVSMTGLGVLGMAGATLPMAMIVALTGFEFLVAFLQAYVFTVLTCIYLNDALHPGH